MSTNTPIRTPRHWLLLRGLSRDRRHWEGFVECLQQHLPADRITCVDLPGSGAHWQQPSPASLVELVNWLRRQSAADREDRPVHLLGMSLGGMLAAEWMQSYPQEVAAAVLINTSSCLNPFFQRLRPAAFLTLLLATLMPVRQQEQLVVFCTSNQSPSERQVIARRWWLYQLQQRVSPLTIVRQLRAATQFRPRPLVQPVLLLASRRDRLVNPACSEKLARFWGGELRLHRSSGHDLSLDDPQWLAEQVASWQSGRPARDTGNARLRKRK